MEDETFKYTYSSVEQQELEAIRQKYMHPKEDKMAELRRLDASVYQKGATISLIWGIVSALVLGVGMCCCMVWAEQMMLPGIVIGTIGLIGVALAYPFYNHIVEKQRKKIAPEILRLTEELMK